MNSMFVSSSPSKLTATLDLNGQRKETPMSAETWAKILYTYGPFAILVFLVVVIERILFARWRAANQNNHPQQTAFLSLDVSWSVHDWFVW